MLTIKQETIKQIIEHAQKELPNEACGYLAEQENVIGFSQPLTNVDHSPEHFSLDPKEQFDAVKLFRSKGYKLRAVYHSHPQTPSRPSQEDIRLAHDPHISYVIISLAESTPVVKSFQIRNGSVSEEHIEIK